VKTSRVLVAGAALFITLVCWSLVFPINSHRDEKFHMTTIWCSTNDTSLCQYLGRDRGDTRVFLITSDFCVPEKIEETYKRLLVSRDLGICRSNTELNENFFSKITSQHPNFFYETEATFASPVLYGKDNLYYKTLSKFASDKIGMSILSMRIFNGFLFTFLFMGLMLIGTKQIRTIFILCFLLTLIPYCFPIIVSVNPSSWGATGGMFFWPFLLMMFVTPKDQIAKRILSGILLTFSALLMFIARRETVAFVVGMIAIFLMMNRKTFLSKYQRLKQLTIFILLILAYSSIHLIGDGKIPTVRDLLYVFSSPWDSFLSLGTSIKRVILLSPRLLGLENPHWQPPGSPIIAFWSTFGLYIAVILFVLKKKSLLKIRFIQYFLIFLLFVISTYTVAFTNPNLEAHFFYIRTNIAADSLHSRYLIPLFLYFTGILLFLARVEQTALGQGKFVSSLVSIAVFTNYSCLYASGTIFRENKSWFWRDMPFDLNGITLLGVLSFFVFALVIGNHLLLISGDD